jgi:hypothetical protein
MSAAIQFGPGAATARQAATVVQSDRRAAAVFWKMVIFKVPFFRGDFRGSIVRVMPTYYRSAIGLARG